MYGLSKHRHLRLAGGAQSTASDRLAMAYRREGFAVRVAPLGEGAQRPEVALLLIRGHETVLVHGYGPAQGAQAIDAVQQLAADSFTTGANRGELIAAAGFTVAAYQAALRLGQITLCEDAARIALLEVAAEDVPAASQARAGEMGRPAWALRALIGTGGTAMALMMVMAAMPGLQGQALGLLHRPASATAVAVPVAANDWIAPANARSSALELGGKLAPTVSRAQPMTAPLPANFNQALSARL